MLTKSLKERLFRILSSTGESFDDETGVQRTEAIPIRNRSISHRRYDHRRKRR